LLTIVTEPLAFPVAVGANCALKLVDWPAFSESGNARELVEKLLPVTLTCVIVSVPVPLLVN